MAKLRELASLIRSKNAGPFLLTFDIMFGDVTTYEAVKKSRAINRKLISTLYGVSEDEVHLVEYDPGMAIKVTIPRAFASGDPLDTDMKGAQQHGPLVDLDVAVDMPLRAGDAR